jgi:copper homeostasis protein CutC
METMFSDIATGVLIAVALGTGGVIMGFFRKISKTQADLCTKVTNLEKALVILCTALDRQTNRLHADKDVDSDLQDLVRKILSDKE